MSPMNLSVIFVLGLLAHDNWPDFTIREYQTRAECEAEQVRLIRELKLPAYCLAIREEDRWLYHLPH